MASIDLQRFEKTYSEWANMELEQQTMMGTTLCHANCEACGQELAGVRVDGNFKLSRYPSYDDDERWVSASPCMCACKN